MSKQNEISPTIPLNKRQLGLWLVQQKYPENANYNVSTAFRINSKLTTETIAHLVIQFFNLHPAFRTHVYVDNGVPMQKVLPEWKGKVNVYQKDLGMSVDEQMEALARIPFDFNAGFLSRINLIEVEPNIVIIHLLFHHMVVDGTTSRIIAEGLNKQFLSHFSSGEAAPESYSAERYFDAIQQHDELNDTALAYWDAQLDGISLNVDLGAEVLHQDDIGTSQDADFNLRHTLSYDFVFDAELSAKIRQYSKSNRSTPFCFVSAIYGVMLNRCFRANDFCIGYVRDVRSKSDAQIPGYFVENVPLAFSFNDDVSGSHMLRSLRADLLNHRNVGNVSASALIEYLREKNASHGGELNVTIGQTIFSSYRFGDDQKHNHIDVTPLATRVGILDTDLTLMMDTTQEAIRLRLNCDASLFNDFSMKAMEQTLRQLASQMLEHGDMPVQSWELLAKQPLQELQQGLGYHSRGIGNDKTFYDIFQRRVDSLSDHLAIIDSERQYSYAQVSKLVNVVANQLRREGVKSGDNVALCLERGIAMMVSVLAIHKAGAAYVPLDPSFPMERLQSILQDSKVQVVVANKSMLPQFHALGAPELSLMSAESLLACDDVSMQTTLPATPCGPVAMILYTSGSTGKPKGVEVKHQGLINSLCDFHHECPMSPGDRILFKENYIFDASVWGLFSWFVGKGAAVVLPSGQERNIEYVTDFIEQSHVTHLFLTPSMLTATIDYFANKPHSRMFPTVKHLYIGAEKFPRTTLEKIKQLQIAHLNILNLYGPTEASIYCTSYPVLNWQQRSLNVPIGKAIANMRLYVVDENMKLLPPGFAGELCVSGRGLAQGYRNMPEKSAEMFLDNPFMPDLPEEEFGRLYRTGDLVRMLEDGNLEYLGRIDTQVKIRGLRIELGEIEERLRTHPAVSEVVAVVKQTQVGPAIAAYVTTKKEVSLPEPQILKDHLSQFLPGYMVPQYFQFLDTIPTTASGKLDRKHLENMALSIEDDTAPQDIEQAIAQKASITELENRLLVIWQEALQRKDIGKHDSFFDLGGHSLLITVVTQKIQEELGLSVSVTEFFRFPNIRDLSRFLSSSHDVSHLVTHSEHAAPALQENEPIAVIGMACRFPGAENVEQFWENLCQGVEGIREFTDDELARGPEPYALYSQPNYVKRKGVINNPTHFDAGFFGYSPKEAMIIDPQQRLFLEEAYHALEDGGYSDISRPQNVGVYGGAGYNLYNQNLSDYARQGRGVSGYQIMMGNATDFLCTRVAYKLNLSGPAITTQTACSTSLVAVERACADLRAGRCEMALAGGVSLISGIEDSGYTYQEGMIMSPDGHCRTFDAKAKGTVPGQGVGVVLLKPLSKAVADGDVIRAVIAGAAVNNDANAKIGYTAPGVEGQKSVIRMAQKNAGVDPSEISYIEAHGTATPMGDPIELAALSLAFKESEHPIDVSSCAIGSVKTNLGHCDTAAGVAGLIKTVLCLEHKTLVPSLHYESPNREIDFTSSPFSVNTETRAWKPKSTSDGEVGQSLKAGVSAFGIGGTNAHVVLEQAPLPDTELPQVPASAKTVLLPVSGACPESLKGNMARLKSFLRGKDAGELPAIAATLQTARFAHAFRAYTTVDLAQWEEGAIAEYSLTFYPKKINSQQKRQPVFVFSGALSSDALYAYLSLYRVLPAYRLVIDNLAKEIVIPWENNIERLANFSKDDFNQQVISPEQAQLLIIILEVGLAHFYNELGVNCEAAIGTGFGQFAAICYAGSANINEIIEHILYLQADCIQQITISSPKLPLGLATGNHWLPAKAAATDLTLCALDLNSVYDIQSNEDAVLSEVDAPLYMGTVKQKNAQEATPYFALEETHSAAQMLPELQLMLASLWAQGHQIDWKKLYQEACLRKVSLFGYEFDSHEFYVVKPVEVSAAQEHAGVSNKSDETNSSDKEEKGFDINNFDPEQVKWALSGIWQKCFDSKPENLDDSFFELGGESIMGMGLIDDLNEYFDLSLSSNIIYEVPTLNALTEYVLGLLVQKRDEAHSVSAKISRLWREHLEVSGTDKQDDFFALGGDSIMALGLVDDINQTFSTNITSNSLYDTPTLGQLIESVEASVQPDPNEHVLHQQKGQCNAVSNLAKTNSLQDTQSSAHSALVLLQSGSNDKLPPIFLVHAAGGGLIQFSHIIKRLGESYTVYGFESPTPLTQRSIEALADTYIDALLSAFPDETSFVLGGHSFGPVVALEMAHQLRAEGYRIIDMLLIDPPGPGKMPKRAETYDDILLHLNDGTVALDVSEMAAMSLPEKVAYFKAQCDKQFGLSLWRKRFTMITAKYIENFKAQLDMMFDYEFKPLACSAIYFEATQVMPLLHEGMHDAWRELILGDLVVKPISGNHITMIDEPGAGQIADGIVERFQQRGEV
ncbi:non-ribosomal peptide synthetase [Alteromonas sp. a30]|uniref:non-ribosomal peptide synthetase n=1 Tax=Alteromonas sp. a30 TaxID=2730917 RepID=UPI0022807401|nr:non-ribosomal peptide synthetase [Alteromonas sp. a30]MCY7297075.1 amino acid adenylation domain-containing protein [Alteromonas sp. a30]